MDVPLGLVLSVDDLEAIVKEHIATGSSSNAVADIVNRVFKSSFDNVGKLIDKAAHDRKKNELIDFKRVGTRG